MGDIGDYWREHKEYRLRKSGILPHTEEPKIKNVACSCGKKFQDVKAITCHIRQKGKKHKEILND